MFHVAFLGDTVVVVEGPTCPEAIASFSTSEAARLAVDCWNTAIHVMPRLAIHMLAHLPDDPFEVARVWLELERPTTRQELSDSWGLQGSRDS